MDRHLPVTVSIYAGGQLVAGSFVFTLDTTENYESAFNVPSRANSFDVYNLRMVCKGPAGPAGWLSYLVSLMDTNGVLLGQWGVPAVLWTRPWPVPMVTHLPQITPAMPVYTVTLGVMKPMSLGPDEPEGPVISDVHAANLRRLVGDPDPGAGRG